MAILGGTVCANCQFWDGARKVSAFKNKAEVRSLNDQGVCTNKQSANSKGKSRKANQINNCNHFVKWDQLK